MRQRNSLFTYVKTIKGCNMTITLTSMDLTKAVKLFLEYEFELGCDNFEVKNSFMDTEVTECIKVTVKENK